MKTQRGFTLIEVLITMAIFSIGILALTAMQISGMGSNQFARTLATASTLAGDKIEKIMVIDSSASQLDVGDHPNATDAAAGITGIHEEGQIKYIMTWTVTDSTSSVGGKTVNINVKWDYNGKERNLNVTYVKGNRGAA